MRVESHEPNVVGRGFPVQTGLIIMLNYPRTADSPARRRDCAVCACAVLFGRIEIRHARIAGSRGASILGEPIENNHIPKPAYTGAGEFGDPFEGLSIPMTDQEGPGSSMAAYYASGIVASLQSASRH